MLHSTPAEAAGPVVAECQGHGGPLLPGEGAPCRRATGNPSGYLCSGVWHKGFFLARSQTTCPIKHTTTFRHLTTTTRHMQEGSPLIGQWIFERHFEMEIEILNPLVQETPLTLSPILRWPGEFAEIGFFWGEGVPF